MKKALLFLAITFAVTHVNAQERFKLDTIIVDVFRSIDSEHYSTPVYVYIKDSVGFFPTFKRDSLVVLNNALTGYQVDSIYEVVASEIVAEANED